MLPDVTAPALLAKYIDSEGISQAELARRAGISRSILSRYLSGNRERPGLTNALKLQWATSGAVPAEAWNLKPRRRTRKQ